MSYEWWIDWDKVFAVSNNMSHLTEVTDDYNQRNAAVVGRGNRESLVHVLSGKMLRDWVFYVVTDSPDGNKISFESAQYSMPTNWDLNWFTKNWLSYISKWSKVFIVWFRDSYKADFIAEQLIPKIS